MGIANVDAIQDIALKTIDCKLARLGDHEGLVLLVVDEQQEHPLGGVDKLA